MITQTDERYLAAIDARLRTVIMEPQQSSDRGCLVTVLKLVADAKPGQRPKLWRHFERTVAARVRPNVSELHRVFDEVATKVEQPDDLQNWIEETKRAQLAERE